MKIAINGFGRIGRNFLRTILLDPQARKDISVETINIGPADPNTVAHMFKYDTLMGTYPGKVTYKNCKLYIDDYSPITIIAEKDPAKCAWDKKEVEWVVDATGKFTDRLEAEKHINAGTKYILITAPAKNEDISIVMGVNEQEFSPEKHKIVSLGSCTTNALVPMVKVLNDAFGIKCGFMTTVHAYTNTQVLLDKEDSDVRRARAAALNIIPTTTGASKMVEKLIPELKGVLQSIALRVPVAKVSLIDLTVDLKKVATVESIHSAFKAAQEGRMKGILNLCFEPLVSSDYNNTHFSVEIDGLLTAVNGSMAKLFGWYDNEWGYSERLKDFLLFASKKS